MDVSVARHRWPPIVRGVTHRDHVLARPHRFRHCTRHRTRGRCPRRAAPRAVSRRGTPRRARSRAALGLLGGAVLYSLTRGWHGRLVGPRASGPRIALVVSIATLLLILIPGGALLGLLLDDVPRTLRAVDPGPLLARLDALRVGPLAIGEQLADAGKAAVSSTSCSPSSPSTTSSSPPTTCGRACSACCPSRRHTATTCASASTTSPTARCAASCWSRRCRGRSSGSRSSSSACRTRWSGARSPRWRASCPSSAPRSSGSPGRSPCC